MVFAAPGKPWKPPRKPKDYVDGKTSAFVDTNPYGEIDIFIQGYGYLTAKQARKLAKWLVSAANYVEGKYK